MVSRTQIFALVAVLLMGVVVLSACTLPRAAAPVQTPQALQQTPVAVVDTVQPAGQPPQTLQMIEASAEDIIDLVPGAGWDRIAKDVNEIVTAWQTYLSEQGKEAPAATRQMLEAALTRLTREAQAQNAQATMQSANQVSAAVVELFDLYHPVVPADLGRLDVYGRQVILDAQMHDDIMAAQNSLHQEEMIWQRLKSDVEARNGVEVAAQYTANLTQQAEAIKANDTAALIAAAKSALELVDSLEQLY